VIAGGFVPYHPSPDLINQFCNFHLGVVKKVNDPDRRGRVLVECPGLLSKGKKNWTDWVEIGGMQIGSVKGIGDEGDWWPVQVGQIVFVGFVSGDPNALWAIPGPPVQDGKGPNKQLVPLEPKEMGKGDARKGTRCRIRKSESGHSLIMDDNGKDELCALLNWTGSGAAWWGPGKEDDEQESDNEEEESKPRKGRRRGTDNVFDGSAPKPSAIVDGGKEYMGILDLLQQGILTVADDKEGGVVTLGARKKDGTIGPCLVLDAKEDTAFLQAGKAQIQLFGDTKKENNNKIFVTIQMVVQAKYIDTKSYFSSILDAIGRRFKRYSG